MLIDLHWLIAVLLLGLAWRIGRWQRRHPVQPSSTAVTAAVQRLLRPRTPDDCPACRQSGLPTLQLQPRPFVHPWRARKSRRGAPKRINTEGFACPTPTCDYYRISDAQVHALVGDGTHGKYERIQTLRCQACQATFSARRDTPLYRLKTASSRIAEVLAALSEGLSIAAAVRVFGYSEATITTWLTRAGEHSSTLHRYWFQNLHLPHVQLDELRTRRRHRAHTLWLWVAVDPISKLIPVLYLGARTQHAAHTVVHRLCQCLAPGCLPVFTSDGLRFYFYALTAHFGRWIFVTDRRARQWQVARGLIYGQVKKSYRYRRLVRVTHQIRCGTQVELTTALQTLGFSGRLNTAFVERVNLTIRQSVAALARRTWSTAQAAPHLQVHLEWWRGYYHFVRPHASLRLALARPKEGGGNQLVQRYRQRTPAMAAGLTQHRWTVQELLALPVPPTPDTCC